MGRRYKEELRYYYGRALIYCLFNRFETAVNVIVVFCVAVGVILGDRNGEGLTSLAFNMLSGCFQAASNMLPAGELPWKPVRPA